MKTFTLKTVYDFGAQGDGITDDTMAIQKALDTGGVIVMPSGNYKVTSTLVIKSDNTVLVGQGPSITTIIFTGESPLIVSANAHAKTCYWCKLTDIRIQVNNSNFSGPIVDWSSMQFGTLENLWIAGPKTNNSIGIKISAVSSKTDATYNNVSHVFVGLVSTCILFSNIANSNTVQLSRFQPMPGGVGISLTDHINNTHIINNGFEYPGHVSGGILIAKNVMNTIIQGNRFESLQYAWQIINGSNSDTLVIGNYYSSIGGL